MKDRKLEMKYAPNTIMHLGVNMYTQLPNALAELIANSYDADATEVAICITGEPGEQCVTITDNGLGMSFDEINQKFLKIGRNKRKEEKRDKSSRLRKLTGRKGLGKLALFGLAQSMEISAKSQGEQVSFSMSLDDIKNESGDTYCPHFKTTQVPVDEHGVSICLTKLKRKTAIDIKSLADSLSRLFIIQDADFKVEIREGDKVCNIDTKSFYSSARSVEFKLEVPYANLHYNYSRKEQVRGEIFFAEKPVPEGVKGISLYAHGRMVNAPSFYASGASSNAYAYMYGYLEVDFIDELPDDIVRTDRQSLVWEHPEAADLKNYLHHILLYAEEFHRRERKKKSIELAAKESGEDVKTWLNSISEGDSAKVIKILDALSGAIKEKNTEKQIVKNLVLLCPPNSDFRIEKLEKELKSTVKQHISNAQYHKALQEAIAVFYDILRNKMGVQMGTIDTKDLVDFALTQKLEKPVKITPAIKAAISASFNTTNNHILKEIVPQNSLKVMGQQRLLKPTIPENTARNIENAVYMFALGITKIRNSLAHNSSETLLKYKLISRDDCIYLLYLVNYLTKLAKSGLV